MNYACATLCGFHLQLLLKSLFEILYFSAVFPSNCKNYFGPHSSECLKSAWKNAGCDVRGSGYPKNVDDAQLTKDLNLQ